MNRRPAAAASTTPPCYATTTIAAVIYTRLLSGEAIPLATRVVSVCDAYDAMAHTRQYRVGMANDRANSILREHAGSQWDAAVVDALITVLDRPGSDRNALDDVGRLASIEAAPFCGCGDALPAGVAAQPGVSIREPVPVGGMCHVPRAAGLGRLPRC